MDVVAGGGAVSCGEGEFGSEMAGGGKGRGGAADEFTGRLYVFGGGVRVDGGEIQCVCGVEEEWVCGAERAGLE